jgi:hypothetical protein
MRRRLLSIVGALGLVSGLLSSGVAAHADTSMSDSTFQSMVSFYQTVASFTGSFCYAPATATSCPTLTQGSATSTSDNVAVCVEYANTAAPLPQSCVISQTTLSGNNIAIVIQIVNRKGSDATQTATQDGTITQHNGSGNNFAAVLQFARQSTGMPGTQTDTQTAAIDQNDPSLTATGRNLAILGESSNQFGQSANAALSQTQTSTQDVSFGAHHINQYSKGVSKAFPTQSQLQVLFGDGSQQQTIDPRCCSEQLDSGANVFPIKESAIQSAKRNNGTINTGAFQNSNSFGTCKSSGNCTITQFSSNNGASFGPTTTTCTPGVQCFSTVNCFSGEGTPFCGTGGAALILRPTALGKLATSRVRSVS